MNGEDLAVRTDVSPSFHPKVLAKWSKELDVVATPGAGTLSAANEGLSAAYSVLGDVSDAEVALGAAKRQKESIAERRQFPDGTSEYLGNIRMGPGGEPKLYSHLDEEFYEAATQALQNKLKPVQRGVDVATANLAKLQERIEEEIRGPAQSSTLLGEIRTYARSLTKADRTKFLASVAQSKDTAGVRAILTGPAYLSGFTPDEQKQLRDMAARFIVPELHAQIAAHEGVIESLEKAGQAMLTEMVRFDAYNTSEGKKAVKALKKLKGK